MKESVNSVNIEGIVSEIDIRDIIKPDKKYIAGEVVVQVIDNQGRTNTIPVSFISADKKKDGTDNKIYAQLLQLKNFNSIASAGIENATKVQIRGARMQENFFLPQNGEDVISTIRINSNFFTKVSDNSYKPQNSFSVTGCIISMTPEQRTNQDGDVEETGRLLVMAALAGYAGKIEVFKFIVENEAHKNFVLSNWKVGDTVMMGGDVRFVETTTEQKVEVGFGEADVKTFTRRTKEFIITKGSAGPLDEEEGALPEAEVKEGLLQRKERMNETKEKAINQRKAPQKTAPAAKSGTFSDDDF